MSDRTSIVNAVFIYSPIRETGKAYNRRATGSFWRGHKLYCDVKITPGVTIFKCVNHEPIVYSGLTYESIFRFTRDGFIHANRACRAEGDVMDNKWFFNHDSTPYYVLDTDICGVDFETARIKKPGSLTKRLKRIIC